MKKRFVAVLLAATLALGSSMSVLAAEEDTPGSDTGDVTTEDGDVSEDDEKTEDTEDTKLPDGTTDSDTFTKEDENGLTWKVEDGVLTISGKGDLREEGKGVLDYEQKQKITSVVIEDGVAIIGGTMFSEWGNVTSVTIPNSVTKIEYSAFAGCKSLPEVTIPGSVKEIEKGIFSNCEALKKVTFEGDAPKAPEVPTDPAQLENHIFPFNGVEATAYYPAGNQTYTDEVKASYGGELTWVELEEEPAEVPKMSFTDVDMDGWYAKYVSEVYSRGLMTGLDDTTFGPSVKLARSHVAVILYRMANEPEVSYDSEAFSDVDDKQFYTNAAMWAKSEDVIQGYVDGSFGPSDDITREDFALMMYRYATNVLKLDTKVQGDLSSFPDPEKVSDYAKEAVEWAVGKGIITGEGDTEINPQGTTKRAECATIIYRLMEAYELL